jgi:Zn-dependent protease
MAAAGPAANLLLVLLAAALVHVGIAAGAFEQPESVKLATVVVAAEGSRLPGAALQVSILFSLNLLLFVFNLIPLPPLDGSSIVQLLLGDDLARRYQELMRSPGLRLVGIVIAWNVFNPLFRPLHLAALNLLYPGSHYQ